MGILDSIFESTGGPTGTRFKDPFDLWGDQSNPTDPLLLADQERLAGFLRRDFETFEQHGMPLIQQRLDNLNSNKMVVDADQRLPGHHKRQALASSRDQSRYGVGMTKQQTQSLGKARIRNNASDTAFTMNKAREGQRDMNNQEAISLANMGARIKQTGTGMMMNSVGLGQGRALQYGQEQSAATTSGQNSAAGIGSLAAMIW